MRCQGEERERESVVLRGGGGGWTEEEEWVEEEVEEESLNVFVGNEFLFSLSLCVNRKRTTPGISWSSS